MKFGWRAWLGVAVSGAALWYTLRGIDLRQVWHVLRSSNWPLLLVSGLVATLTFPPRAFRWRVILEPVTVVPVGPLWRAVAIGMMVNNVVPARAGEVARAFAITREARQLPFTTAVASLAVDRIFDGVVVVSLMVIAIATSDIPPETAIGSWSIARITAAAGGVALLALLGITLLAFLPGVVTRVFDASFGRIAPRFHASARRLLDSVLSGFASVRSPRRFLLILAWATVGWLINSLAFYLGFLALGIDAPFASAVVVQSLIALAVAAPSTPGFVGVFELAATQGLSLYGIPADLAFSWGLGFHFVSFIPITLIGLYYFSRLGMHFGDLGRAPPAAA